MDCFCMSENCPHSNKNKIKLNKTIKQIGMNKKKTLFFKFSIYSLVYFWFCSNKKVNEFMVDWENKHWYSKYSLFWKNNLILQSMKQSRLSRNKKFQNNLNSFSKFGAGGVARQTIPLSFHENEKRRSKYDMWPAEF